MNDSAGVALSQSADVASPSEVVLQNAYIPIDKNVLYFLNIEAAVTLDNVVLG